MSSFIETRSSSIIKHFKSSSSSIIGSLVLTSPTPLTPPPPSFPQILRILAAGDLSNFCSRRFESVKAETMRDSDNTHRTHDQALEFPEGKVKFTPKMRFISETAKERECCYRILDDNGNHILSSNHVEVSEEVAVKMYTNMVTLQTMDTIFYEAQRQGRISFYLTTVGEEAINIASAAALTIDDIVFPQYREAGVLLWRGFTLQEFANQCFSNKSDYGKGRQMPIHYGSNKLNYVTVASTVAWIGKMHVVVYVGDGGTSEEQKESAVNGIGLVKLMDRRKAKLPILHAIQEAEKVDKPPVADIFTDVYDSPSSDLHEQEKLLRDTIRRHPCDYPSDVPL
ncbi:hypothetical protein C1H46_024951 [Malus baccata]|uniref:Dehydrogenase E1 component domain-containing protein n=1 Tax=Malus baccata TaxID=106549 RepID=A0A540LSM9_MALBA|nr:hypothetical protein C1H46_024951 [Malus baccata]